MNYFIYLAYPLLVLLILWGCKFMKKEEYHKDFLSLSQTKSMQGFLCLFVMLHHIGQKSCAPWLEPEVILHGLECFVPIGYLLVGVFLFFSGFGLYKSYTQKSDYLQGFMGRRCLPPILALLITNLTMSCIRSHQGEYFSLSGPLRLTGPVMLNGYSWFVYTLLLFYMLFYLAYKYCKKEKIATLLVLTGMLLYIFFCDWWMYGTWWYNSTLLFGVGILFARYEKKLIPNMRKYYHFYLPAAFLLTCFFFFSGEYTEGVFRLTGIPYLYETGHLVSVTSQIFAACGFVLLCLLLGMKIKIGNRILMFLGKITLEFYLLHGIFLQLFTFNETQENPLRIKNAALLVLVVFLCTLLTAYPFHLLLSALTDFILKHHEVTAVVRKDLNKFIKWSFILILVITLFTAINNLNTRKSTKETVTEYIAENITFANVDGLKMSAYITGEGEHTIVFLRGHEDPCPSITLSPLADQLARRNKVIILDYFGCGFSDSTDKKRTAENFVYEIHTALKNLDIPGPYIFAPHEISGLYVQLYTETYREEVEAVIGLDSSVAPQPDEMLAKNRLQPDAYRQILKKQGLLNSTLRKLLYHSGYGRMVWPIYGKPSTFKITKEQFTVLEEQFIEKYYSPDSTAEMVLSYDNHQTLLHQKYPQDLPVLFMLSHYACGDSLYPGSDWIQLHKDLCSNPEIQSTLLVSGSPYFVYYHPDHTAKTMQEFIDSLDTSH